MKIILQFTFLTLLLCFTACGDAPISEASETQKEVAEVDAAPMGLNIGDVAPDFSLTGTDGMTHSLAATKAAGGAAPKGYIVTFTCNTCPYAKMYEARLIALHEKMAALGYPVVAIQPNDVMKKPGDNMAAMQARAKDKGYGFAYLLDAEQSVYPVYGASKTPEVYLLDANRVLQYHGAIDDNAQDADAVTERYVEQAVAALEAGSTPDPTSVKAIGCSIKAK
ncbi:thioredoxin family protein [Neolewinella persica]|uniref:thioredoxin family protein n=1 Tax=Neolewinella persica TaxID=70998 RepID=UPI0003A5C82B|nr:thioredoxin family protein [Neolewinella persica]